MVDDFEGDGSCCSGEFVSCSENNGNVDDVAVEKGVAVEVVKFVGAIVVMSMNC